jgi:hypothetical protein
MNAPADMTPEQEEWLAARKRDALNIDPETAEVTWCYADSMDPYGVDPLPEEYQSVGRVWYARSPNTDIWVAFFDLPDRTFKRLEDRMASGGLQETLPLCRRILAVIHDEPLDSQLHGLTRAIFLGLLDAPLSPEQRASRLREIAEYLIAKMASFDSMMDRMNAERESEEARINAHE